MKLFEIPEWKVGKFVFDAKKSKKKDSPVTVVKEEVSGLSKNTKTHLDSTATVKTQNGPEVTDKKRKRPKDLDRDVLPNEVTAISKQTAPTPKVATKVEERMRGARFRYLNQKLYESSSKEALDHFQRHPDDFARYHEGFREQTKSWPVNPVDEFIARLQAKLSCSQQKHQKRPLCVADMGCGDAKIAQTFTKNGASITVHSFDLVATSPLVTVASMTNVPLEPASCDIVIFCLSLMNTDFDAALCEANRILRAGGELWIAEVASRLEDGAKGIDKLLKLLGKCGFEVKGTDVDRRSKVFVSLMVTKKGKPAAQTRCDVKTVLKPCLYKKR